MIPLHGRPVVWILISILKFTIATNVNTPSNHNAHSENELNHENDKLDVKVLTKHNDTVESIELKNNKSIHTNKSIDPLKENDLPWNEEISSNTEKSLIYGSTIKTYPFGHITDNLNEKHEETHDRSINSNDSLDSLQDLLCNKEVSSNRKEASRIGSSNAIENITADLNEHAILDREYKKVRTNETNNSRNDHVPHNHEHSNLKVNHTKYTRCVFKEDNSSNDNEIVRNRNITRHKWDYTNITTIYLAGFDDQIYKLMYDIQKHGLSNELLIYFYIYDNYNYRNIGYFYTDIKILRNCLVKYTHYFCLDLANSGRVCSEILGLTDVKKHPGITKVNNDLELIPKVNFTVNTEPVLNKIDNIGTTTTKPNEYYPLKKSSGVYEFILPKENEINFKNINIDLLKSKLNKKEQINGISKLNYEETSDKDSQHLNKLNISPNKILNVIPNTKTSDEALIAKYSLTNNITSNHDSNATHENSDLEKSHGQSVIELCIPNFNSTGSTLKIEASSYQRNGDIYLNNQSDATKENINKNIVMDKVSTLGPKATEFQNITLNNTNSNLDNNTSQVYTLFIPDIVSDDKSIHTSSIPEYDLGNANTINETERYINGYNTVVTTFPNSEASETIPNNDEKSTKLENKTITKNTDPYTVIKSIPQVDEIKIGAKETMETTTTPQLQESNDVETEKYNDKNIIMDGNVQPHIYHIGDVPNTASVTSDMSALQTPDIQENIININANTAQITPDNISKTLNLEQLTNIEKKNFNNENNFNQNDTVPSLSPTLLNTNIISPNISQTGDVEHTFTKCNPFESQMPIEYNKPESSNTFVTFINKANDNITDVEKNIEQRSQSHEHTNNGGYYVTTQPYNKIKYQLLDSQKYPNINPWNYLLCGGTVNKNQPMMGQKNQNYTLDPFTYRSFNKLENNQRGIGQIISRGSENYGNNSGEQSAPQNTDPYTTQNAIKYMQRLNTLKALLSNNKNIIKYLEPAENQKQSLVKVFDLSKFKSNSLGEDYQFKANSSNVYEEEVDEVNKCPFEINMLDNGIKRMGISKSLDQNNAKNNRYEYPYFGNMVYQPTLERQNSNTYYILDPCTYKNILTMENVRSPTDATINNPPGPKELNYQGDTSFHKDQLKPNHHHTKEELVPKHKDFNSKADIPFNHILTGPLSKYYNVYLSNLPQTKENLYEMYSNLQSLTPQLNTIDRLNQIPNNDIATIPNVTSKLLDNYPGLKFGNIVQNISDEREENIISPFYSNKGLTSKTLEAESLKQPIIKYFDYQAPHTLKPTSLEFNAHGIKKENLNEPIIKYVNYKPQETMNNIFLESNLLNNLLLHKPLIYYPTELNNEQLANNYVMKSQSKAKLSSLQVNPSHHQTPSIEETFEYSLKSPIKEPVIKAVNKETPNNIKVIPENRAKNVLQGLPSNVLDAIQEQPSITEELSTETSKSKTVTQNIASKEFPNTVNMIPLQVLPKIFNAYTTRYENSSPELVLSTATDSTSNSLNNTRYAYSPCYDYSSSLSPVPLNSAYDTSLSLSFASIPTYYPPHYTSYDVKPSHYLPPTLPITAIYANYPSPSLQKPSYYQSSLPVSASPLDYKPSLSLPVASKPAIYPPPMPVNRPSYLLPISMTPSYGQSSPLQVTPLPNYYKTASLPEPSYSSMSVAPNLKYKPSHFLPTAPKTTNYRAPFVLTSPINIYTQPSPISVTQEYTSYPSSSYPINPSLSLASTYNYNSSTSLPVNQKPAYHISPLLSKVTAYKHPLSLTVSPETSHNILPSLSIAPKSNYYSSYFTSAPTNLPAYNQVRVLQVPLKSTNYSSSFLPTSTMSTRYAPHTTLADSVSAYSPSSAFPIYKTSAYNQSSSLPFTPTLTYTSLSDPTFYQDPSVSVTLKPTYYASSPTSPNQLTYNNQKPCMSFSATSFPNYQPSLLQVTPKATFYSSHLPSNASKSAYYLPASMSADTNLPLNKQSPLLPISSNDSDFSSPYLPISPKPAYYPYLSMTAAPWSTYHLSSLPMDDYTQTPSVPNAPINRYYPFYSSVDIQKHNQMQAFDVSPSNQTYSYCYKTSPLTFTAKPKYYPLYSPLQKQPKLTQVDLSFPQSNNIPYVNPSSDNINNGLPNLRTILPFPRDKTDQYVIKYNDDTNTKDLPLSPLIDSYNVYTQPHIISEQPKSLMSSDRHHFLPTFPASHTKAFVPHDSSSNLYPLELNERNQYWDTPTNKLMSPLFPLKEKLDSHSFPSLKNTISVSESTSPSILKPFSPHHIPLSTHHDCHVTPIDYMYSNSPVSSLKESISSDKSITIPNLPHELQTYASPSYSEATPLNDLKLYSYKSNFPQIGSSSSTSFTSLNPSTCVPFNKIMTPPHNVHDISPVFIPSTSSPSISLPYTPRVTTLTATNTKNTPYLTYPMYFDTKTQKSTNHLTEPVVSVTKSPPKSSKILSTIPFSLYKPVDAKLISTTQPQSTLSVQPSNILTEPYVTNIGPTSSYTGKSVSMPPPSLTDKYSTLATAFPKQVGANNFMPFDTHPMKDSKPCVQSSQYLISPTFSEDNISPTNIVRKAQTKINLAESISPSFVKSSELPAQGMQDLVFLKNIPFAPSSSGGTPSIKTLIPTNLKSPTLTQPKKILAATSPSNIITFHSNLPGTSTVFTKPCQLTQKFVTKPSSFYSPSTLLQQTRIPPWKLQTTPSLFLKGVNNVPSLTEIPKAVNLDSLSPNAYISKYSGRYKEPVQVIGTEISKKGLSNKDYTESITNIKLLNEVPVLSESVDIKTNSDISKLNLQKPTFLSTSNIPNEMKYSIEFPESSKELPVVPNLVSPYIFNIGPYSYLASKATYVPEFQKITKPAILPKPTRPQTSIIDKLSSAPIFNKVILNTQPVLNENLPNLLKEPSFAPVIASNIPTSEIEESISPPNLNTASNTLPTSSDYTSLFKPLTPKLNIWNLLTCSKTLPSSAGKEAVSPLIITNLSNTPTTPQGVVTYATELGSVAPSPVAKPVVIQPTMAGTSSYSTSTGNIQLSQQRSSVTTPICYNLPNSLPTANKMTPGYNYQVKTTLEHDAIPTLATGSPKICFSTETPNAKQALTPINETPSKLSLQPSVSQSQQPLSSPSIVKPAYSSSYVLESPTNIPMTSSSYLPYSSMAWKSLASNIQAYEKPLKNDLKTKPFLYSYTPHRHISTFVTNSPEQSQTNVKLGSDSISPYPLNIPKVETSSTSLLFKSNHKVSPNNYGVQYTIKDYPQLYQNLKSNLGSYKLVPLKYKHNHDFGQITTPVEENQPYETNLINLPQLVTPSSIKNEEQPNNNAINSNLNEYVNPSCLNVAPYMRNNLIKTEDLKDQNVEISAINKYLNKYITNTNILPNILGKNQMVVPLDNVCLAKCDPKERLYYLKTENPDILIKAWPTIVTILKPKVVIETEGLEALNFCPIVRVERPEYSSEVVQNIVENYVRNYYGEPIVIKSNECQKHEFIHDFNESYIQNHKVYIVWANKRDC